MSSHPVRFIPARQAFGRSSLQRLPSSRQRPACRPPHWHLLLCSLAHLTPSSLQCRWTGRGRPITAIRVRRVDFRPLSWPRLHRHRQPLRHLHSRNTPHPVRRWRLAINRFRWHDLRSLRLPSRLSVQPNQLRQPLKLHLPHHHGPAVGHRRRLSTMTQIADRAAYRFRATLRRRGHLVYLHHLHPRLSQPQVWFRFKFCFYYLSLFKKCILGSSFAVSTWPRPPHPDSSRQYSPSPSPGSKRTSPTVRPASSGRQSPGKDALPLVNQLERQRTLKEVHRIIFKNITCWLWMCYRWPEGLQALLPSRKWAPSLMLRAICYDASWTLDFSIRRPTWARYFLRHLCPLLRVRISYWTIHCTVRWCPRWLMVYRL